MQIVINKTKHGIYVNGGILVPGTNTLDEFDGEAAQAKFFVEAGEIEIKDSSKMTEKEQQEAVDKATTKNTLEKLEKTFKKVDTSKRKKTLDDFDKAVKEAEDSGK